MIFDISKADPAWAADGLRRVAENLVAAAEAFDGIADLGRRLSAEHSMRPDLSWSVVGDDDKIREFRLPDGILGDLKEQQLRGLLLDGLARVAQARVELACQCLAILGVDAGGAADVAGQSA